MPKANIQPTCKYGHGPLDLVNQGEDSPKSFGLVGIGNTPQKHMKTTQVLLVLDVFECHECGYTELFEAQKSQP